MILHTTAPAWLLWDSRRIPVQFFVGQVDTALYLLDFCIPDVKCSPFVSEQWLGPHRLSSTFLGKDPEFLHHINYLGHLILNLCLLDYSILKYASFIHWLSSFFGKGHRIFWSLSMIHWERAHWFDPWMGFTSSVLECFYSDRRIFPIFGPLIMLLPEAILAQSGSCKYYEKRKKIIISNLAFRNWLIWLFMLCKNTGDVQSFMNYHGALICLMLLLWNCRESNWVEI